MVAYISADMSEISERRWRECDDHFGGGNSLSLPQDKSQRLTFSYGIFLPASAWAKPSRTAASNSAASLLRDFNFVGFAIVEIYHSPKWKYTEKITA